MDYFFLLTWDACSGKWEGRFPPLTWRIRTSPLRGCKPYKRDHHESSLPSESPFLDSGLNSWVNLMQNADTFIGERDPEQSFPSCPRCSVQHHTAVFVLIDNASLSHKRHMSCTTAPALCSEPLHAPVTHHRLDCFQLKYFVAILSKIFWIVSLFTLSVATPLLQGNGGEHFWFPLSIAFSKETPGWIAPTTQL